jgi:hypothetical protein
MKPEQTENLIWTNGLSVFGIEISSVGLRCSIKKHPLTGSDMASGTFVSRNTDKRTKYEKCKYLV